MNFTCLHTNVPSLFQGAMQNVWMLAYPIALSWSVVISTQEKPSEALSVCKLDHIMAITLCLSLCCCRRRSLWLGT